MSVFGYTAKMIRMPWRLIILLTLGNTACEVSSPPFSYSGALDTDVGALHGPFGPEAASASSSTPDCKITPDVAYIGGRSGPTEPPPPPPIETNLDTVPLTPQPLPPNAERKKPVFVVEKVSVDEPLMLGYVGCENERDPWIRLDPDQETDYYYEIHESLSSDVPQWFMIFADDHPVGTFYVEDVFVELVSYSDDVNSIQIHDLLTVQVSGGEAHPRLTKCWLWGVLPRISVWPPRREKIVALKASPVCDVP